MKNNRPSICIKVIVRTLLVYAHICPAIPVIANPLQPILNVQPKTRVLQHSSTFEGRGDGIHFCPVSGEAIRNKHLKFECFGRTVYFCCEGCFRKALREPDRYIKSTLPEQENAVKAYVAKAPQTPSGDEFCNE